jgi:hypothetical protein
VSQHLTPRAGSLSHPKLTTQQSLTGYICESYASNHHSLLMRLAGPSGVTMGRKTAMPQRPAGETPDGMPEQVGEPAPTAQDPALGRILATTRQVRGQSPTVTPGFGPLPAIYLPAAPLSPLRAGRGRTARLRALALRVVCLFAGVRRHRASQDGYVEGSARRLRSIS